MIKVLWETEDMDFHARSANSFKKSLALNYFNHLSSRTNNFVDHHDQVSTIHFSRLGALMILESKQPCDIR